MNVRPLSKTLQDKAEKELNEQSNRNACYVERMKSWIADHPHLKIRVIEDNLLLSFLRGTKYSVEKAKEKIEFFYNNRILLHQFFHSRDPLLPEIQAILKAGYFLPLKTPNHNGEKIILVRLRSYDPSKTREADLMSVLFMIMDILLNEDDNIVVAGIQFYIDLKDATLKHYFVYTPRVVGRVLKILQQAYPIRIRGLNFAFAPIFFDFVYNIFKYAIPEKIRTRVSVCRGGVIKSDDLPIAVLPEDCGGKGGSVELLIDHWKIKTESYRDRFLEDSGFNKEAI